MRLGCQTLADQTRLKEFDDSSVWKRKMMKTDFSWVNNWDTVSQILLCVQKGIPKILCLYQSMEKHMGWVRTVLYSSMASIFERVGHWFSLPVPIPGDPEQHCSPLLKLNTLGGWAKKQGLSQNPLPGDSMEPWVFPLSPSPPVTAS